MNTHYTDEVNTQIVISLLKEHKIKKVIASPGATNIRLVASMQQDDFFEMYSVVDERSAAYIACGMAEESGEPVVLTCTGATASRNYIPGLTEAFYRKLPIVAITSTQHYGRVGQNVAQVIDRSRPLADIVKCSVQIPTCHTDEDRWDCNVKVNNAILELTRNGGGPIHIDLETTYSTNFDVKELPKQRVIRRYTAEDSLPPMPNGKIGVFVGAHSKWSEALTAAVDRFCAKYNAVVLCDQTSNYRGAYRVLCPLALNSSCNDFDVIVDIGNITGAYPYFRCKEFWRVNPDGEIRDTYKRLTNVFQMSEQNFFEQYSKDCTDENNSFLIEWKNAYDEIYNKIPKLPFSNIWIAKQIASKLPENSILHLSILNTLRSWNFFETPNSVRCYSNTGGFGIDGVMSAAIGSALANRDANVYCIIGDLAFFYDMNSLGNRHLPSNLNIMLINNGKGTEFRNYNHPGAQFADDADAFIAAADHYGAKSHELVKHYASDLGCEYMSASSKDEYLSLADEFFKPDSSDKPVVFEVFTDWKDESDALEAVNFSTVSDEQRQKNEIKNAVKKVVGKKGIEVIKKIRGH